ncbi:MAG: RnfABCDGE type electron transport complex subunit B [Psychrilyobacter sp.]|nr:RnfABCDGE type electron transport complex subunit B [Psychrilyobacter sp.]
MINAILVLGGIGLVMGLFLAFASKKFEVEIDPNVEKIIGILPGANCGACGFPGCGGYADAVALEGADPTLCAPGGSQVVNDIADIMGGEGADPDAVREVARVKCQGDNSKTSKIYNLDTEMKTCATASLYFGGDKSCWHGCLGYGDCVRVCPADAIEINARGIAVVNEEKCISCTKCVKECPKNIIEMLPENQKVTVLCNSKDKGATARKACTVACIACGMCVKACPVVEETIKDEEGNVIKKVIHYVNDKTDMTKIKGETRKAVTVTNNLAKIDTDICINCGLCSMKCPTNAIENQIKEVKTAEVIADNCIGCTLCARVCPVDCIEGKVKEKHVVDQEKCIGCGLCFDKCNFKAIKLNVTEIRK